MIKIKYNSHGQSGNIFDVMCRVWKAIGDTAGAEMFSRASASESYEDALKVIGEYVELVDIYPRLLEEAEKRIAEEVR